MHSCYDYNYNNYQKPQQSRGDYKIPHHHQGRQILFVTFMARGDIKHLSVEIESKVIFVIRTYSKGQTYFFALGNYIVSDKTY